MCTVSYLPLADGYILTSNRDEAPHRHATEIVCQMVGGSDVYFPMDPERNGSWIGFSTDGNAACLLNGAIEDFDRSKAFPRSRGQILLRSFAFGIPAAFVEETRFEDYAPFRLLLKRHETLHEVIWNGRTVILQSLSASTAHFRSSATLYSSGLRRERQALFEKWLLNNSDYNQRDIVEFHRGGGNDDNKEGFVINRAGKVKTLSITSIQMSKGRMHLLHKDLQQLTSKRFEKAIQNRPKVDAT